jgi:hypothetical protein
MKTRFLVYVSLTGVAHSDDLIYLFPQPNVVLNTEDRAISRTVVELWTNFATNRYVSYLFYFPQKLLYSEAYVNFECNELQ